MEINGGEGKQSVGRTRPRELLNAIGQDSITSHEFSELFRLDYLLAEVNPSFVQGHLLKHGIYGRIIAKDLKIRLAPNVDEGDQAFLEELFESENWTMNLLLSANEWIYAVATQFIASMESPEREDIYYKIYNSLIYEFNDNAKSSTETAIGFWDLPELLEIILKAGSTIEFPVSGFYGPRSRLPQFLQKIYQTEVEGRDFTGLYLTHKSVIPWFVHLKAVELGLGDLSIESQVAILRGE